MNQKHVFELITTEFVQKNLEKKLVCSKQSGNAVYLQFTPVSPVLKHKFEIMLQVQIGNNRAGKKKGREIITKSTIKTHEYSLPLNLFVLYA